MDVDVIELTKRWMGPEGPRSEVVVSSRVRHARNLERVPFPPCADKDDLRRVEEQVGNLITSESRLGGFSRIDINSCNPLERAFLKESHVISAELERGGRYRSLYVNPDQSCAVMVNEEDHLRMYCLLSGLRLESALEQIDRIDAVFGKFLLYAFSDKYGYLTSCPSNVGTGMRASVMLHLPGLVMTSGIEEILKTVPPLGMTVRGYYGENSEFLGDFYQISNEVTLGKTEAEIVEMLQSVVSQIIRKELAARETLFQKKQLYVEDVVWRAFALLTHARILASKEAFKLLSPIRLGIDRGYFPTLTHHELNRLVVAVQPAHIQLSESNSASVEERDVARAQFLRSTFQGLDAQN